MSVHFMSQRLDWRTPEKLYADLDKEFGFTYEACPVPKDGWNYDDLAGAWGEVTFCNPPYGTQIPKWVKKAHQEAQSGKTVVLLIPARTDTAWWHDYVMKADEIRFIRGRLRFGGATINAPFPSCVVVWR